MISPADILAFGNRLLASDGAAEIDYRNAARAAYYSVYHLMADAFGLDTGQWEGRHEAVRDAVLAASPASASQRLMQAKIGWERLRRARVLADYAPRAPFDRVAAEEAVLTADKVFNAAP